MYNLHQHALDHSLVILVSLCAPVLVTLEWYQWRFAHLHVFTLNSSQFPHPTLHMYPTQKVIFPLFRFKIGWVSLPEQLLKIVFNLHCSVGGPLRHYLLPVNDRMIGFLLGISMLLLVKCYWKYSSNILSFFCKNLLIFQHLESFDGTLLIYFWEGRIQFTDWDIYF